MSEFYVNWTKVKFWGCIQSFMLPWKLPKRQILPVNQNLSSVYFSLSKFQLVSCYLSLAMIGQMTHTHKLPELCSATLTNALKRTATGPDQIPYWVWKEHAEFSRFLSPKSGISQSLLSVCHHCGSEQLSPPSPKWMFLKHMVIIVALI